MSDDLKARIEELEGLLSDESERADRAENDLHEANSREDELSDANNSLRTEVDNLKGALEKVLDLARDAL